MVTFRGADQILYSNEQYIIDLINSGVDLNTYIDHNEENLLHYSISRGNYNIGRLLIDGGIDINKKNNYDETSLMYLVDQRN